MCLKDSGELIFVPAVGFGKQLILPESFRSNHLVLRHGFGKNLQNRKLEIMAPFGILFHYLDHLFVAAMTTGGYVAGPASP